MGAVGVVAGVLDDAADGGVAGALAAGEREGHAVAVRQRRLDGAGASASSPRTSRRVAALAAAAAQAPVVKPVRGAALLRCHAAFRAGWLKKVSMRARRVEPIAQGAGDEPVADEEHAVEACPSGRRRARSACASRSGCADRRQRLGAQRAAPTAATRARTPRAGSSRRPRRATRAAPPPAAARRRARG